MKDSKVSLTSADVERLLTDPSAEARAGAAAKVAGSLDSSRLSADERKLAEDIIRILVHDAEIRVRQALSDHLKENPEVPRDVALKLAEDVGEVAAPILRHSQVLTDDDLIRIVSSKTAEHQKAVAQRRTVSSQLSDAIAENGTAEVVATLMANQGADIAEKTFHKVLDKFAGDENLNTAIVHRKRIPISVAEHLVTLVSDSLRERLVSRHALPADMANDLVHQSRERATIGLLSDENDRFSSIELANHLHSNGRLTSTIVLRALCVGDLDFFEAAMARLAGIGVSNAHSLIHDRGQFGFRRLFEKCRIPERMYPFFRAAVDVAHETDYDGGPDDRRRYRDRMIQRVLTSFEDGFDRENLDYLIGKLGDREQTRNFA